MTAPLPAPLFVGDHPGADFLNSVGAPYGATVDWLRDGAALVDWMAGAGLLEPDEAAGLSWDAAVLDDVAARARDLREALRAGLTGEGELPVGALNAVLAGQSRHLSLIEAEGGLALGEARPLDRPDALLGRLAEVAADLLAQDRPDRTRICAGEGCTFWFRDQSKNGRRRWCDMSICGNRAKARAFRDRAAR